MWQLAGAVIVRIGTLFAAAAVGVCTVVLLFCIVYQEEWSLYEYKRGF